MKYVKLFEEFVKKYGDKITSDEFKGIANSDKKRRILYYGAEHEVLDSDGIVARLRNKESGETTTVNLSMFNKKGAITETIKASEAYNTMNAVQTILDGKRELAFISTMDNPIYAPNNKSEIEAMNYGLESGLKSIEVKNKKDGKAWILYKTDKKMAQKLADYAAEHEGYLSDSTPEEARYVGNLLGYDKKDIEDFVKRVYKK